MRRVRALAWVVVALAWVVVLSEGLLAGVELAVTVAERDVARFGSEAALADRLREIAGYCQGDCAEATLVVDGDADGLARVVAVATGPGGGYSRARPLNASEAYVARLAARTGGDADAWPRYGGPAGRPIASLPYFSFLDESRYARVFHADVDVRVRFDAVPPPRWVPRAVAILEAHADVLAVHPPAWQSREKLCRAREARNCARGAAFHTNWSLPVVGHATTFSARLFLLDVARYRALYPRLRADCPSKNRAAIAAATSAAFADFFVATHGPGSANQHWEAFASCAALLAGYRFAAPASLFFLFFLHAAARRRRADMCGTWAVSWHDNDRRRPPKIPRKCMP